MQELKKGSIVIARVTGIAKFGIFVDVNSKQGLIHISEISDSYIKSINKLVEKGEYILARVIQTENDKLTLSIKELNYKVKKTCITYLEGDFEVSKYSKSVIAKLNEWVEGYEEADCTK